ncbi:tumor necrosis factor a (TNF superfamily, member 2) [Danio aesculapii]|uniref:tumor necrosis factor a (TNF superfamily, member 2) n=1 Tax=Danio aesculapii TaxID=1142201 RepID=UPI0024C0CC03|nr:tumor necrosis factor a (TNF superfamily, member 2) [Danio aesculapii]
MKLENWVVLDVENGELPLPQVMVSRRKAGSSKSGVWRVFGVILAVGLCAAAAVCFTLNKTRGNQQDGSVLRLTLRDHFSQANFTSKAAIHLTGGYNSELKILDWKDDQDQAFSSGGLKLVNSEIIIPDDGIYFVYSQVSFHISCTSELTEEQMSHAVMRFSDSYGGKKPLFSAIRSICTQEPESENLWYNTIYLGAAFHLREGDRLGTDTTTALLPMVENENGKTFFGVFAL